jgi:hypothetical protein
LPLILQLDDWHHPNELMGEKPSRTETFDMIADVLATGEPSRYRPSEIPNTHWSHWSTEGQFFRDAEKSEWMESNERIEMHEASKPTGMVGQDDAGRPIPFLPKAKLVAPSPPVVPDAATRWRRLGTFVIRLDRNQFYVHDADKQPFKPFPDIGEKHALQGWTRTRHSVWYFTTSPASEVRVDVYLAAKYEEDGKAQRVLAHNLKLPSGRFAVDASEEIQTVSVEPGDYVVYCRVFNRGQSPPPDRDEAELLARDDFERYEFVLVRGKIPNEGLVYGE